jgi:hypothetical protein
MSQRMMFMKIHMLHYTQILANEQWDLGDWQWHPTIWPVTSTSSKAQCTTKSIHRKRLTILGEGEVVLEVLNGCGYQLVGLKLCLHVQGLWRNLFSVPAAVAKGSNMGITKNGCALTINGQKIGVGTKVASLYHLKTPEESTLWVSDDLQHRRVGHSCIHPKVYCKVYNTVRHARKSFPKKNLLLLEYSGLVCSGVWPFQVPSNIGMKYVATFILKNTKVCRSIYMYDTKQIWSRNEVRRILQRNINED